MQKTTFAGLTELDVSESVLEDNGAFTGRDRATIDRFLEIGAKTHRHTGLSGLSNPTNAASAAVVPSGGTIAAALSMSVGYTAQDDQRGETLLSPVATVSTPGPLPEPGFAPSAEVKYDSGSLTQDNYYYGITYLDSEGGETPLGPVVAATRQPGYPNARVLLTHLNAQMAEVGATSWRLYRQRAGGAFAYLASGTGSSYTDDGTVSPVCDTTPPNDNFNTTNSINSLTVTLPMLANLPAGTAFINLYLSQSGSFSGQSFLAQFPVASAGQTVLYTSLELQDDQPPDVNTSIGGADKIDPDTELEDWHWKRPVTGSGALGSGEDSDVRVALDTNTPYIYRTGSGWVELQDHVRGRVLKTGAEHRLIAQDDGGAIEYESSVNGKLIIPSDAVVTIPVGSVIQIVRAGSGAIGVSPSAGVNLRSKGGASAISAIWGVAHLRKRAANDWLLYGDI